MVAVNPRVKEAAIQVGLEPCTAELKLLRSHWIVLPDEEVGHKDTVGLDIKVALEHCLVEELGGGSALCAKQPAGFVPQFHLGILEDHKDPGPTGSCHDVEAGQVCRYLVHPIRNLEHPGIFARIVIFWFRSWELQLICRG